MNIDSNSKLSHLSDRIQTLQMLDQHCQYLKDGKLLYTETKLRAENHICVAEKIIFFRVFRQTLEGNPETVKKDGFAIPPNYADLIAALVQDSEEGLSDLCHRIDSLLSPFQRNEELAPYFLGGIEKSIRQLAALRYYGLNEDVFKSIQHNKLKIPWHLSLYRWEVHDIALFPPDMQNVVLHRRQAREQMSFVFSSFINTLPPVEKESLVNTKHRRIQPHKEIISIEEDESQETSIEKEEKRKKKEEEKKRKEEEKKQRDEEKRQRDEEKKQRDEEKRQREEEKKRVREEEKKQKEEEKKLREEEKKRKENEKKKKDQSQLRLTSLFTKTIPVEKNTITSHIENVSEQTSLFPPFYIKENVKMAKINTFPITCTDNFMQQVKSQQQQDNTKTAYLDGLSAKAKQKRGTTTHIDIQSLLLPGAADILHNPNVRLALCMKLLQYSEDVRPAYYGTFTKKSHLICGRDPLKQDTDILDYTMDSEAEWEPEGEGEDIHSDEDEDDPNTDMIDPEDANWLVPEGYLSDSEGIEDEEGHTDKSKHKSHTSSKRVAIRKVILGPFFQGEGDEDEVMKPFELQFLVDSPLTGFGYDPFYKEPAPVKLPTTSVDSSFTDEHKTALINVINGKADSIPTLVSEAKSNWLLRDVSKRQLEAKIKDMAIKEKRGTDTKPTWYLKQDEPPATS